MKINNQNLLVLAQSIKPLMDKELTYKTALKLTKNAKVIDAKVNEFAEDEKELINKYAEKDENDEVKVDENGNFNIPTENIDKFVEDRTTLYELEIEVEVFTLTEDDLSDLSISANQLVGLLPIIEE